MFLQKKVFTKKFYKTKLVFTKINLFYTKIKYFCILRELHSKQAERPGLKMDINFRGHFLQSNNNNGIGLDLISIALKQERDHGLPSYNSMRVYCGLEKVYLF